MEVVMKAVGSVIFILFVLQFNFLSFIQGGQSDGLVEISLSQNLNDHYRDALPYLEPNGDGVLDDGFGFNIIGRIECMAACMDTPDPEECFPTCYKYPAIPIDPKLL